jgi:hypothetical protein
MASYVGIFFNFSRITKPKIEPSQQLRISTQIYLSLLTPLFKNGRNTADRNIDKYEHMFIL